MPYQVGFCDDEVYQIKVNHLFLNEIASKNGYDFECHGFSSGKQLKNYLASHPLDLLFLDIDLGEESGIDAAAWVSQNYPHIRIVFVTGHREFAEEAFEVEALGYLVKPYDIKKMEKVLKRAVNFLEGDREKEPSEIIITDENIKKKINRQDILFVERQQSKSIIVTRGREYQVYETMTSLCERLGDSFLRINQGEIVNCSMIKEIKGNTLYLKNGKEMSIGRTYRKEVLAKYFDLRKGHRKAQGKQRKE